MKKAGEFLRGIRKSDALVRRKKEQLDRLRSMLEYKSPVMDASMVAGGNGKDVRGDNMCRMVDLQKELEEEIAKLLEDRAKAMRMIDTLDNADMVSILYMRYLDYRTWEEIAWEVGKSTQWVFELNRRAIRILEGP